MKDRFDNCLKAIMDEESKNISMSDELKERILKDANPCLLNRIKSLLNGYIEIPVPVAVGAFALVIMINLVPALNVDIDFNNRRIIEIGNSQVIVRELEDVKNYED